MASLKHAAGHMLICLAFVAGILAQDRGLDPVPIWDGNGRVPDPYANKSVFLTSDKHAVIVLVPNSSDGNGALQRRIVRVPLWNDIRPTVTASVDRISGITRYEYSVANGPDAHDPLGKFSLIVPSEVMDLSIHHLPSKRETPWSGAAAFVSIAPQVILQKPLGRYLTWFYQGDNVVPPGATLDGFTVESAYLPGLTTAWLSAGRLVEFDQSWPKEIFRQLLLLEDRRWREGWVITVGPIFPPEAPRPAIVEAFRDDFDRLIRADILKPSSAFTVEAVKALNELHGKPNEEFSISAQPQTSIELAAARALKGSLGMSSRSMK